METKAFYLTSEFWVTVAAVVTSLSGILPVGNHLGSTLAIIASAAYALARGLAKSGTSPLPSVPVVDEGDAGKP